MTAQRLNPLKTLTDVLFAPTNTAANPGMKDAVLASLEEARKAAAVFAEAVTRAHDLVQPVYGRDPADNDAAVTFNGVAPQDDHYSRYATFKVTDEGFTIRIHGGTPLRESACSIRVDTFGRALFSTMNDDRYVVSATPLSGHLQTSVLTAIGAWANRTFDAATLANIKRQSETVILVNQLRHPSKPGCWESPFTVKPV